MAKKVIALLLCALSIMGILAGCAREPEDILGKVGETNIYRWYFNPYLLTELDRYEESNGVNLREASKTAELKRFRELCLERLVGKFALYEEARVRGLTELSAEQEAEVDTMYNEYVDGYMASLYEKYPADANGRQQAEAEFESTLEERALTREALKESYRIGYILDLVSKEIVGDTSITDEQIRQYYDNAIVQEQESIAEDPAWFGNNARDESVVIPEGYLETARITVKFTDMHRARIASAQNERDVAVNNKLFELMQGGELSESAVYESEEVKAAEQDLQNEWNDCYEELMPRMTEIREMVLGGADFIKTMEEVSDDTRLIAYYVSKDSTHLEDTYKEAALKLQKEGDISGPVRMSDGLCIILLVDKMQSGIRSYEDVYEAIRYRLASNLSMTNTLKLEGEYGQQAWDADIVTLYYDKLPS